MVDETGKLIADAAGLEAVLPELSAMPVLAVDTETTGLDPRTDSLLMLQLGDDKVQHVIDCRAVDLAPLRPLLEGRTPKVLHNAKFDYGFLAERAGIRLENVIDTMLLEILLLSGREKARFSLQRLTEKYLGEMLPKAERETFESHAGEFAASQLAYARRDVEVTYRVLMKQMPLVREEGLEKVAKLECLAACAFADMERTGVYLDTAHWRKLIARAEKRKAESKAELDKAFAGLADRDLFGAVLINYDSEDQVRAAFAKDGIDLTDTAESTLKGIDHPAARALLSYREHQKVVSTYGEAFLEHVHPKTGRIHPSFQQIGADSGRVSCREPNLQNIKADSEFRRCFAAPTGRRIVTADYSGIELRILAEFSGDPVFVKTFNKGGDLHAIVASTMFDTPVTKKKNPELRQAAKAINFGLAYGMGAQGLASQIGKSVDEAQALMDRYFAKYAKIRVYLEDAAERAVADGFSTTPLGRKRFYTVPENRDTPEARRAIGRIRRQGKNTPIQGTNADITKLALVWLRERIAAAGIDAQLVNTVHDEIVVECAEAVADETAELLRKTMVEAGEQFIRSVPVEVDLAVAEHWSK